jgi:NAD-reducing hydrogenase large subunit
MGTPKAETERKIFREAYGGEWNGCTLLYHYTRLIELVYCLEKAENLLRDEQICNHEIRITADVKHEEGIGMIEAPRGTLIHHYTVDPHGAVQKVNLIVATGHNNIAMNRSIQLVAREYIHNGVVREGLLNRVEGAIRCYDPCLSCSTHAAGPMALEILIHDVSGKLVNQLVRN